MSSTARDTAPPPSGRSVLAFGLLMSASASFQLTEFVQVSLTPSWLLPVLAAWLAAVCWIASTGARRVYAERRHRLSREELTPS